MPEGSELRLYFDYISPNAYIAWKVLPEIATRFERRIDPVPVLYPGLLGAHGLLGPMEVAAKARWMKKDVLRKVRRLGLPFGPPPTHPFNPLLALRVSSLPMESAQRRDLVDRLFDATWGGGPGVTDAAVVARLATEAGLDGEAAVARCGEPEAKARLRRQTDDALAAGVFGVPTVLADGELFWGFDDFAHLELFLSHRDAFDREMLGTWEAIRPSSWRREVPGPDRVRRP